MPIKTTILANHMGCHKLPYYQEGESLEKKAFYGKECLEKNLKKQKITPNAYQYHLKDHLGNTRLTFTTEPKTIGFNAFYEDEAIVTINGVSKSNDMDLFELVASSSIIPDDDMDHTDAGSIYDKSQMLNGQDGSIIGSVLTIPVGAGDIISAEVYAKYIEENSTTNPLASIGSLVIGAITGNTGTATYEGAIGSSFGSDGSMITNTFDGDIDYDAPFAFLNMMFLPEEATSSIPDEHFAFAQMGEDANIAFDKLAISNFEVPGAGYIIVYLSNENLLLTEVYFDDLLITVEENKIIQTDDYYPFGLSYNSWQRTTAKENRFKFQGQELINDLNLEWNQYRWRNGDPSIGRFFNIDPIAESFFHNSTYAFSENKVVSHVELEGLESVYFQAEGRVSIPLAGVYGVTGSGALGLAFDLEGNIAAYYTLSFGGQVGALAAVGVSGGVNPFIDLNGVEGWGFNAGLAGSPELIGLGFSAEGNLTIPTKDGDFLIENVSGLLTSVIDPDDNWGGGLTLGVGPTAEASVYADGSYTSFFWESTWEELIKNLTEEQVESLKILKDYLLNELIKTNKIKSNKSENSQSIFWFDPEVKISGNYEYLQYKKLEEKAKNNKRNNDQD